MFFFLKKKMQDHTHSDGPHPSHTNSILPKNKNNVRTFSGRSLNREISVQHTTKYGPNVPPIIRHNNELTKNALALEKN